MVKTAPASASVDPRGFAGIGPIPSETKRSLGRCPWENQTKPGSRNVVGSDEGGQSGAVGLPMSPAQSRGARGLLGWSEAELARRVGVDERFVRDFEAGHGDPPAGRIEALRSALMSAGAVFTDSPCPGVRLEPQGQGEGTRLDDLTTENDR